MIDITKTLCESCQKCGVDKYRMEPQEGYPPKWLFLVLVAVNMVLIAVSTRVLCRERSGVSIMTRTIKRQESESVK
jgi:uncharacterized protein YpmS